MWCKECEAKVAPLLEEREQLLRDNARLSVRVHENELHSKINELENKSLVDNNKKLGMRTRIAELEAALEAAEVRFNFLKGHSPCIGATLCHVDGNCVHCFAVFASKEIKEVLGEK